MNLVDVPRHAVLLAALLIAGPGSAAPAASSPLGDEAARAAAMPGSAATAQDVPGTSSTIRMLLDLQSAPQAPGAGGDTVKPARQLPPTSTRAAAAAAPQAASLPTDGTAMPETVEESGSPAAPTRWSSLNGDTGSAEAGRDPALGAAKSAHEGNPTVLRRMVSALREHRMEVFVGGLLVLALAAVGTIMSARQRSARGRKRLTASRSQASRPRHPPRHPRP